MNTVIDSDTWTGLAPYNVLTDYERTEDLQFGASIKLLLGGIGTSLFLFGCGVLLITFEVQGYKFSEQKAAALNWPILKAEMGCLMVGLGLVVILGWWRRWLIRYSVVPLTLTNRELRFGSPSQTVRLNTITKITFHGLPETLSELARALSPRVGGSGMTGRTSLGPLLLSTQRQTEPFKLDLAVLKGDPSRIGLIICDRIQKLQSRTGNANV